MNMNNEQLAKMYYEWWQMAQKGVEVYREAYEKMLQEYLFRFAGYSEGEN